MTIEKVPATKAPWPPTADDKGRIPTPYPLTGKGKESFYTIADALKKGGIQIEPVELVKLNFRTTNPAEVNWYLKTYVGCMQTTADGKNYSFGGLVHNGDKGLIYVPTAAPDNKVVAPDELVKGPVTPREKDLIAVGHSFEAGPIEKEFETSVVRGTISLTAVGKVVFLDANQEASIGRNLKEKGDLGVGIARKITDDVSIQVGSKLQLKDLVARKGSNILKSLKENFEATVSKSGALTQNTTIGVEAGLTASPKPIIIRVSVAVEEKADIGKFLGLSSLPVAYSVTVTVAFQFGPAPGMARAIGVGGLVGAAMLAFIGFGAWYATDISKRGTALGKSSIYIEHFLYESGFRATATPPNFRDLDEVALASAGAKDALLSIDRTFPEQTDPRSRRILWMSMWIIAGGGKLGTKDGYDMGGVCLENYLLGQMRAKYGF